MARGFRGIGKVRRMMRDLPENFRRQMVSVLNSGGRALQSSMRAKAPRRTGATREGITYKVSERTMKLRVGLLGTRAGRSKLFYARIQDLGRKAQVAKRRYVVAVPRNGYRRYAGKRTRDLGRKYHPVNVRAMAGKHFVTGSFPVLRQYIGTAVRGIWSRALRSIASGGND
ncbi:HK97 gp10 family phage protein [Novosphingobium sp. EMRT-2]|uniref:HK97 gp10 family phage protein n=1 Tax=Novosphingobium sp. EMRT-2 TaxID=2571749 RepID=UPI0010BD99D9|nr:HK97 gp10 family phage protein [Novosphingobium sp. EMRT-2]QCI92312.1 HK97 gp10 family phage protein [Novosphingobium sp. EMRT-2]